MKRKEVQQQKTIVRSTAEEWDDAVNEFMSTLLDDTRHETTIERSRTADGGFQAVIIYWKSFTEAESIRDEFYLRGETYRCDDCPHLRRNPDRRVKWLECGKGMYETTQGSHEACEWYYEQIYRAMKEDIK